MNQRIQQTDRTRTAIVDAASELVFGSASPDQFTMQNIADAAGVSHRTLYRYFPSRQDLIDAVGAAYDEQLDASAPSEVLRSFDEWISAVERVIGFGAAHRETFQRALALSVVTGQWRSDRDRRYWELFRERFAHLDEETAREDFAALRHLLSAASAVIFGDRFGLSPEATAAGIDRAVHALVSDIARRDDAAGGRTA